jgi:hypothetical protein
MATVRNVSTVHSLGVQVIHGRNGVFDTFTLQPGQTSTLALVPQNPMFPTAPLDSGIGQYTFSRPNAPVSENPAFWHGTLRFTDNVQVNPDTGDVKVEASSDYLTYFFLRNRGARGLVLESIPGSSEVNAQRMLTHARGPQLFKCVAISPTSNFVLIVNQVTQFALKASARSPFLTCVPQNAADTAQHWAFTAKSQLTNAAMGQSVLSSANGVLSFVAPADDAAQQFEMFFPSDFVYVRNSASGRFLTAMTGNSQRSVLWQPMSLANDDGQQWGLTSDGHLVSRLTAQVLQTGTSGGGIAAPSLGDQTAQPSAYQLFDFFAVDGTIHSQQDHTKVIGVQANLGPGGGAVTLLPFDANDQNQLAEFISPLQFFLLQNKATTNWLTRDGSGPNVHFQTQQDGNNDQLFTVSRYGELISPMDGFVLQSAGANPATFVDTAPQAIGFATTTFRYAADGTIASRATGLQLYAKPINGTTTYQAAFGAAPVPNYQWSLQGQQSSLLAKYESIAVTFFANPAPLPGQQASGTGPLSPAARDLIALSPKTVLVIKTLVIGCLGLVGISVGSGVNLAVDKIVSLLATEDLLLVKIAVIMQGTITAASVIAVADGITKAGLWMKILALVMPNSFWGWAVTIAKLSITIASFIPPFTEFGAALKGAQVAILVADIAHIVASDPAEARAEAARLVTQSQQLRANAAAQGA